MIKTLITKIREFITQSVTAISRYNMAHVRHTLAAKDALALFDHEMMLPQRGEDNTSMLQVPGSRRTVNQNIIKEDENKLT
jgi:hypothetical protein